jgi:hypothetical protein
MEEIEKLAQEIIGKQIDEVIITNHALLLHLEGGKKLKVGIKYFTGYDDSELFVEVSNG